MKGFGTLLALASVSLLLICGPPAVASGEQQNYLSLQNDLLIIGDAADGLSILAETPGVSPAGLQVVPDPGSCGGQIEADALARLNILRAVRPRNILRQGVRLLNFLPCC